MTVQGFWRDTQIDNRRASISGFGQLNNVWYVFPDGGAPNYAPQVNTFSTMADLSPNLRSRDTIILGGVLREYFTAPLNVHDILLIGAQNLPRQATSSGTPNTGGATWLSPATVVNTSPLLKLTSQGWRIEGIYFNNAGTTAPCIQTFRDAGTYPAESDASHTSIDGCIFTGTDDGIQDSGGCNFVNVSNCLFTNFVGASDTAMSFTVGAGQGTLQDWRIINNRFINNVNHIVMGLTNSNIYGNEFSWKGQSITTTLQIVLTGGAHNSIWENKFGMATTTAGMTAMFAVGTEDSWGPNHFSNAVQYGSPLTTA